METPRKEGFFGPMKAFSSAQSSLEKLPDGGLRASIMHDTMRGMTIDQLLWWFHNIDQTTTFNGHDFSGPEIDCYQLWHPHDHIKVQWKKKIVNGQGHIQPESVIHINETFQGFVVNESTTITQFDREAFNFEMRPLGMTVGHLLHIYEQTDEGIRYRTEMQIQCRAPIVGRLITQVACRFFASEAKLRAWMIHNVEEVGESEKFIPQLYNHAMTKL